MPPSQTQQQAPLPQLISNPAESHQSSIIACAVITWSLSALFVGLRFYTRGFLLEGKVLGAEDWVLLVALVMKAIYGRGKHALDVDPALVVSMGKAGWYTIFYYMLSLLFTKISILLLYMRILSVCLVSTIRLWDLVAEASRPDFTFDNVSIAYLTCSEVNGAIVVACCMTLKPFFDRASSFWCLGRLRLTKSDSSGKSDVGDSDVEAQHYCKQLPRKKNMQGVAPKGRVVMAMAQPKRRGSWSWLYTSSSQSQSDEGDIMKAT
ncbi:hypothetical protein QBC45DRAFT_466323 [Copromyces sp. CBS 386.78]|nr:hypothetical protein QBC45DRAFT_466323 [Copromyces sp. CBS 386.78]